MLVEDLVKFIDISISNGETLLFVNAIAGTTTVLGAFDPIAEVFPKFAEIMACSFMSMDHEEVQSTSRNTNAIKSAAHTLRIPFQ